MVFIQFLVLSHASCQIEAQQCTNKKAIALWIPFRNAINFIKYLFYVRIDVDLWIKFQVPFQCCILHTHVYLSSHVQIVCHARLHRLRISFGFVLVLNLFFYCVSLRSQRLTALFPPHFQWNKCVSNVIQCICRLFCFHRAQIIIMQCLLYLHCIHYVLCMLCVYNLIFKQFSHVLDYLFFFFTSFVRFSGFWMFRLIDVDMALRFPVFHGPSIENQWKII